MDESKIISPLPLDQVINKWAIVAIDRFQEALISLNVGDIEGDLMKSFTKEVTNNGGDAWTVLIKFLKYGRFVDMGVGRGHPLGAGVITMANGRRATVGGNHSRAAKKWYSRTKTREVAILAFILKKQFSIVALRTLQTELQNIDKNGQ